MIDEKKLIEERPEWLNPDCAGNEEYNKGWNACNKYWCNTIKRQPKVGEWIPCSERLPEEYGSYLVAWKPLMMFDRMHQHYYEIVEFDPDDEALWIGNIEQAHGKYEIIAWQPLPEPYKGE